MGFFVFGDSVIKTSVNDFIRNNFLFLLIILGTFYVYSHAIKGPFIWDDEHFILRNPSIRSVNMVPEYFTSKDTFAMDGNFAIYRPLRNISYLIDYIMFGLNPLGFHFINLLLHVQNIVLVGYLAGLMTGKRFISISCAALFALHPIQTEAVSWIKGRDDLIVTFFYLASLALYVKGRRGNRYLYWGSVASFAMALFSKETAITLPLIILAYNYLIPEKEVGKGSYHPFFYLSLLYLLARTVVVGKVAQAEYWGGSFLTAFYTNWTGMVYYLKLFFLPANLCADYLMFPIRTSLFDPYVLGALIVILIIIGAAFISFRTGNRLLSFSILWFFITLLPVSNIVPIQIVIAERFLYLPSVGIFLGVAISLSKMSDGLKERSRLGKTPVLFLFLIVSIFLASITVDRNHVWTDEHTFWTDVASKSPGNTRAWHNLGTIYQNQGRFPDAISHYKKALMMGYHSPETHYQLGRVYRAQGDDEKALPEFFEALKEDPENADISYETANLMSKKGWYSEAIFHYKKTLQNDPNHIDALNDLGLLYMRQMDYGLAAVQFKKLLTVMPGNRMAEGFLEYCRSKEREG